MRRAARVRRAARARRAALALLVLAGPAAAQGWEGGIVALAPALSACLADRPGAMVVDARPAPEGVAARLLLPGGAREDCVASPAGTVATRHAVATEDRLPGEGLRAFMPERRCADAARVTDAAGRELGWLAYAGCG